MKNPTALEKAVLSVVVALCIAFGLAVPALADFDTVSMFATNSIDLNSRAKVLSGDIVVNNASPGPTLEPPNELEFGSRATSPSGFAVKADSIKIFRRAEVDGDVFCNELDDNEGGTTCTALSLPVFDSSEVPTFPEIRDLPPPGSKTSRYPPAAR